MQLITTLPTHHHHHHHHYPIYHPHHPPYTFMGTGRGTYSGSSSGSSSSSGSDSPPPIKTEPKDAEEDDGGTSAGGSPSSRPSSCGATRDSSCTQDTSVTHLKSLLVKPEDASSQTGNSLANPSRTFSPKGRSAESGRSSPVNYCQLSSGASHASDSSGLVRRHSEFLVRHPSSTGGQLTPGSVCGDLAGGAQESGGRASELPPCGRSESRSHAGRPGSGSSVAGPSLAGDPEGVPPKSRRARANAPPEFSSLAAGHAASGSPLGRPSPCSTPLDQPSESRSPVDLAPESGSPASHPPEPASPVGLLNHRNLVQDEKLVVATLASLQQSADPSNIIKQDLRLIIQSRRKAEGKGELHVDFKAPPKDELTEEEWHKALKRRHQNRRAAQRFRMKQRQISSTLSDRVRQLENQHRELMDELHTLEVEKVNLLKLVAQHSRVCKDFDFKLKLQQALGHRLITTDPRKWAL